METMEQPTMPPAGPLTARYRVTEHDFLRVTTPLWRRRMAMGSVGVIIGAVIGTAIGKIIVGGDMDWTFVIWVFAVTMLLDWLLRPWTRRFYYRRYKAKHDEYAMALQDDGLRFTSPKGESLLAWSEIGKWRYNADYMMIYKRSSLFRRPFFIIPTTVAERGFDMNRFMAVLARHVGPAKWGL